MEAKWINVCGRLLMQSKSIKKKILWSDENKIGFHRIGSKCLGVAQPRLEPHGISVAELERICWKNRGKKHVQSLRRIIQEDSKL